MDYKKYLFAAHSNDTLYNAGILLLRIIFGLTMIGHGWGKFVNFTMLSVSFPDPIGLGSMISLSLVVFAELFASILLLAGLASRMALIPLIINMLVAFFIVHAADPFANKELAFLYLIVYIALMITGPGKFSIDYYMSKKKNLFINNKK